MMRKPTRCAPRHELPFASVVILNYNGEAVIERCLSHVLRQRYPHFEVIVIDDASTDSSPQILSRFRGDGSIRLKMLTSNQGIACGRNTGILESKGEVIAFVDNDGYPEPDWLAQAVSQLLSADDIGAVASAVMLRRTPDLFNGIGGRLDRWWEGRDHCFQEPYDSTQIPHEVVYPMGCGMVFRRKVLIDMGSIDTRLRRWFDDVELGIRTWLLGYRVVTAPAAILEHDLHVSYNATLNSTSLRDRFLRSFNFEASRIRTNLKFRPTDELRSWLRSEIFRVAREMMSGQARSALVRTAALFWNLLNSGSAMRIRYRTRRTSGGERRLASLVEGDFEKLPPQSRLRRAE